MVVVVSKRSAGSLVAIVDSFFFSFLNSEPSYVLDPEEGETKRPDSHNVFVQLTLSSMLLHNTHTHKWQRKEEF